MPQMSVVARPMDFTDQLEKVKVVQERGADIAEVLDDDDECEPSENNSSILEKKFFEFAEFIDA